MSLTVVGDAPAPSKAVVLRGAHRTRAPEAVFSGLWFAAAGAFLALAAPLFIVLSTPSSGGSAAWPLAWVLSAFVGLRYAWLVALGRRRMFELVVWLFAYVFLGLAPLAQMKSGRYPGTTPNMDESLNAAAMWAVIVGCIAFAVGTLMAGTVQKGRAARPVTVSPWAVSVLTLFAVTFALLVTAASGLGTLFSNREARGIAEAALFGDPSLTAIGRALATLPLVVSFVGLMHLRDRRRPGERKPFAMIAVVLLLTLLVFNPISTARYGAGTALLGVLVALGAVSTPRRYRIFALAMPLALILVFPYAAVARTSEKGNATTSGNSVDALVSPDFDAIDQLNNTILLVRTNGNEHGRQLVGAGFFFVPRAVWKSKPTDSGPLVAEFRDYQFTNLSEPLWAEFFLNGSWVGLALGMGALGFTSRRLDLRGEGSGRPPAAAAILPFYFIILLRGSLLQAMAGLMVLAVCSALITRRPAMRPVASRPK